MNSVQPQLLPLFALTCEVPFSFRLVDELLDIDEIEGLKPRKYYICTEGYVNEASRLLCLTVLELDEQVVIPVDYIEVNPVIRVN